MLPVRLKIQLEYVTFRGDRWAECQLPFRICGLESPVFIEKLRSVFTFAYAVSSLHIL